MLTSAELKGCITWFMYFLIFLSFIIVGYMWQTLGRRTFLLLPPPHPWAGPKKPIPKRVKIYARNIVARNNIFKFVFFFVFFLIIRIISGKVLQKQNTNDGTWINAHLQICGFLLPVTPLILATFQRNLIYTFRRDSSTWAWKKYFRSFYAFELMIYFLVEEDLLNMHSDTLLNIITGVWIM